MGPISVLISEIDVNVVDERGARCSSEDCWTKRELGVAWRMGKRASER